MLVICCLTSNANHVGHALSTTRLVKTKWSRTLSDFWFEDFFLLVIDVVKPPGTYNIDCRISLILEIFEVQLFFPCYQRSFVCSAGSSSRVSNVFVINSTDKHCMQVGKSNTIPSAKTLYIYAGFYITSHAWLRLSSFNRRPHLHFNSTFTSDFLF